METLLWAAVMRVQSSHMAVFWGVVVSGREGLWPSCLQRRGELGLGPCLLPQAPWSSYTLVSVQLVQQSTFPLWLPGPQPTTGRETKGRGEDREQTDGII